MSSYDELKMLVRTHDAHTSEVERVRREAAATLADVTRDKDAAVAAASAATAECAVIGEVRPSLPPALLGAAGFDSPVGVP